MEEWEARKGGYFHSSVTILFPSFLISSSYPFQLEIPHINYVSELFEEVDLDTFLKEDQATLTRRGKQSVAHATGELWDHPQHECGEGEVPPNNVLHDMMLQVHVHAFSLSTLFTNPFLILFKPESAPFTYLNISFFFQGIRQIRIGTKLQEVGRQCQYEGWTYLHYAMAEADMSYLQEMCSELFGDIEEDELVPGQFDSPPAKKLCVEVEKEETKAGEASGLINPSGSTTKVYTDQLPIPRDLGVPPDHLPHWESVKKEGAKGG